MLRSLLVTTLAQIVAVATGVKTHAQRDFTDAHHRLQKAPLLTGISRVYQPKDEEGEALPPESTRVQVSAIDVLDEVQQRLSRLFDVVLTQDDANTQARADVVVDDRTILADVPVTYLLFLDKRLDDLLTFVNKLPVLDPADVWNFDAARGCYAAEPAQTVRSKKVPRNHVKAHATERHPAQVEVWMEDVPVGIWTTTKLSGALPAARVKQLRDRVVRFQQAVKQAREQANSLTITDRQAGAAVFAYLFE
jgi:hypothetical protein